MRIGDYVKPIEPITGDTPGGLAFDRFQADPNLMVIAVVDAEGRPVGLIERNALFLKMAAAFGRELYAGRPISGLMNHNPVVADEDEPADAFFRLADSADAGALLGGFIATRQGRYVGPAACWRSCAPPAPSTCSAPTRWPSWRAVSPSPRPRPAPPAAPGRSSWR